ncbi:thiamine phosphate synthase [Clostridium sp. SYSU_GA19001]|uniref:thiamine phosphate synthase n=1 Tax=Clostridium caldaquaticum TaxID=2940653 RepID=UPI002076FD0D|nr:thiamine phosphate synthase [Clostridium caldaquaticum]MCM8710275.1 thiamine phosphate synthase [Clostridium caldaquaticum]
MQKNVDYSLYLVTDREVLKGRDLCHAVEQAIQGGVTIVQLREKYVSSLEFYKTALEVKNITDKYNVPLIINDRLDIAIAVDAHGVHLGQSDIPCKVARKILGDRKIVGISTATVEEAIAAEKEGADYIGVGAMYSTQTKTDTRFVTIETLAKIKQNINIPVVAIGGINENNFKPLKNTGIDGLAIVSAILGRENIKEAAQSFR